jgi:hypothetical protein
VRARIPPARRPDARLGRLDRDGADALERRPEAVRRCRDVGVAGLDGQLPGALSAPTAVRASTSGKRAARSSSSGASWRGTRGSRRRWRERVERRRADGGRRRDGRLAHERALDDVAEVDQTDDVQDRDVVARAMTLYSVTSPWMT